MFAQVAEERSFASAARTMGVSVATVSRSVSRLEERLGGRLFNRTSRRLALTDFGRGLFEPASRIYSEATEAEHFARETSGTPRGLVKLTAPQSLGAHWVAPILPAFLRQYPDVTIDLHLTDVHVDIVGEGFDVALRSAVVTKASSLITRLIVPVRRFVVASPSYLTRYGCPRHPQDLQAHPCLTYANKAMPDSWRFTNRKSGEKYTISPTGPLRGTCIDALLPTVLDGVGITELPEFVATQYFREKQLEPLLVDWCMPEAGLYFVTPSARARPAKVSVLADFLIAKLADAPWKAEVVMGWKPPEGKRKRQT
jgi:DNA-binding transcriptional LysR family regulator